MSFFGLFGSKPESKPEPSESSELFASTTFASPSPSPSTSSSSTAGPSAPAAPITAPTALDTFSSASAFDPRKLHPLAGLGDNIDFLTLEEGRPAETGEAHVLPSRGWTDDLCVGTGTTYLSGLAVGGMWGFKEGFSRPLGSTPSFKLRLNSILNGCTRRGSFMGNSLGVLAIFYNLANSSIAAARGESDVFNSLGAAAISGAIFKSTAGVRPAMVGAGLMTAAAGGWSFFKTLV